MGLDQYLYGVKDKDIADGRKSEIYELCYWRKCNWLHKWVADVRGEDTLHNCSYYELDKEWIEDLAKLVDDVLANPMLAEDYLPTQGGFFFGSVDYDDWYFEDLKDTKQKLKDILAKKDEYDYYLYYAWW